MVGFTIQTLYSRWRREKKSHHFSYCELDSGSPARSLVITLSELLQKMLTAVQFVIFHLFVFSLIFSRLKYRNTNFLVLIGYEIWSFNLT